MKELKNNMKEKLLRLMSENPELEVRFVTDNDLCEFSSRVFYEIEDVTIDKLAKYRDEELLNYDEYYDELCGYYANEYENDDQLEEFVERKMQDVVFNRYILVLLRS